VSPPGDDFSYPVTTATATLSIVQVSWGLDKKVPDYLRRYLIVSDLELLALHLCGEIALHEMGITLLLEFNMRVKTMYKT